MRIGEHEPEYADTGRHDGKLAVAFLFGFTIASLLYSILLRTSPELFQLPVERVQATVYVIHECEKRNAQTEDRGDFGDGHE